MATGLSTQVPNVATQAIWRDSVEAAISSALVRRAQIDAEDQDAVLDRAGGIADDGEVLEVGVGLVQERLAFGAGDGWKWALLDRGGALTESGDHLVDIEGSHGATVLQADASLRSRCG